MNTVELDGKHYTAHVKEGDVVKKGDVLLEFDLDAIKAAGYDITTPVIVCNAGDYANFDVLVNNGDSVGFGVPSLNASNL